VERGDVEHGYFTTRNEQREKKRFPRLGGGRKVSGNTRGPQGKRGKALRVSGKRGGGAQWPRYRKRIAVLGRNVQEREREDAPASRRRGKGSASAKKEQGLSSTKGRGGEFGQQEGKKKKKGVAIGGLQQQQRKKKENGNPSRKRKKLQRVLGAGRHNSKRATANIMEKRRPCLRKGGVTFDGKKRSKRKAVKGGGGNGIRREELRPPSRGPFSPNWEKPA